MKRKRRKLHLPEMCKLTFVSILSKILSCSHPSLQCKLEKLVFQPDVSQNWPPINKEEWEGGNWVDNQKGLPYMYNFQWGAQRQHVYL